MKFFKDFSDRKPSELLHEPGIVLQLSTWELQRQHNLPVDSSDRIIKKTGGRGFPLDRLGEAALGRIHTIYDEITAQALAGITDTLRTDTASTPEDDASSLEAAWNIIFRRLVSQESAFLTVGTLVRTSEIRLAGAIIQYAEECSVPEAELPANVQT